ncbi:MAG: hypothetical protein HZC17_03475 [Candidatus Omnitrophica bacterium]|nr:hypothetical protein [Candidatus Omnitrophota bacterium]
MVAMRSEIQDMSTKIKYFEEQKSSKDIAGNSKELVEATKTGEELGYLIQRQDAVEEKMKNAVDFDLYNTLDYKHLDGERSRFDARNIELLAKATMSDRLSIFGEIEFERTAETSGVRAGQVEVEQAWLEYYVHDLIKPRAGVVLVPFGKYNLEHFQPFQYLTDRPIVESRVIPATWSEAGAGSTGGMFLGDHLGGWFKDFSLDYQLYFINGLTDTGITDTAGLRQARGAYGVDNNNNKAFVGRLGLNPFSWAELGASGYFGKYSTSSHKVNGFDLDAKLKKGPFEVKGEYALFDLQEGGFQSGTTLPVPETLRGFYVQGAYKFWFNSLNETFLGRGFSDPTFVLVFQYDNARIDDDSDPLFYSGTNNEERWTIGLNYRPVATWALKLEYQWNRMKNEPLENGNDDGFVASVTAAF